jgi:hypothetical protein
MLFNFFKNLFAFKPEARIESAAAAEHSNDCGSGQPYSKAFVTFADSRYQHALTRIRAQAESFDLFSKIVTVSEDALDEEFRIRFQDKLKSDVQGFGFWCWKPQLILQTLNELKDGDIILYADAGCHLNVNGKAIMLEYFSMAETAPHGIVGFQLKEPDPRLNYDGRRLFDYLERHWIKGDLVDYFGVRDNPKILDTQTIAATSFLIRKCDQSMDFMNTWMKIIREDFSLLDDSPSSSRDPEGFVQHRFDQSIFSVLCKLRQIQTLSYYDLVYPTKTAPVPDLEALREFPILKMRDY